MLKSKLYLFNPENDLALALGCRHYTPPPHAAQLHRAGALLPAWWCKADDCILAPYEWIEDDIGWLQHHWGLTCNVGLPEIRPCKPLPWGWSEDTRRQFIDAGVHASELPDDSRIKVLRNLSHRRTSIAILSALGEYDLIPEELTDPFRALQLERQNGGMYFKSPWSCSGRGVFCAYGLSDKAILDKTGGIIHRQGSVMAEKGYDKLIDFGVQFECVNGNARYKGLSMFLTEQRGTYAGNIVASQEYYIHKIDSYGLLSRLQGVISALEKILSDFIAPQYDGWLGVDMIVYRHSDGSLRLHPCIEMNLRMTMGAVAMFVNHHLSDPVPRLMSWGLAETVDETDVLLKPREGFALTLKRLSDIYI